MMVNNHESCSFSKAAVLCAGLLMQVIFVGPVAAQQAIIDERQAGFKDIGAAMKTLRDELKGDEPSTETMTAAAEQMAALAAKIPAWFPAGSGPESGLDTDARDYIWTNKEKFDRITDEVISATKAMVPLTTGADLSALKKQLLVVRDSCSSCHDSYRVD